ncbi:MAG: hypothetical protein GXO47_03495 [Chlorobi bacterium]|nr:hypothetical protein [Chlorobiota bacterium]
MFRYCTLLLLIFTVPVLLPGQEQERAVPEITIATVAMVDQGNSYITFPADIGNIERLWFEANLNPSFLVHKNKKSRLMGVITPQVIFRMYQEPSLPVRTPSYMPQLTFYYNVRSEEGANSLSLTGKIAHHSNGQDGKFLLDDGEVNLKDGSFFTNYFELGVIKTNYSTRFRAVQFFKTSVEMHPKKMSSKELDGIYGFYRWKTAFSIFRLPETSNGNKRHKAQFSVKGKMEWMLDEMYDWSFLNINRLNLSLTFFYHPKFFEDIGFFTTFYHGMDYYNIYFGHQITVLRFGIMTDKLRF